MRTICSVARLSLATLVISLYCTGALYGAFPATGSGVIEGYVWLPDGQPAVIYRADVLGQAVFVPAGRCEVSFEFAPGVLKWSIAVSVTTLAFVVGVLAVASWRRR